MQRALAAAFPPPPSRPCTAFGKSGLPRALAAAFLLLALLAQPGRGLAVDRAVAFAFDQNFPPFSMLRDKKPTGFEIEVLQAVLEGTGLKIEHRPMDNWDKALTELSSGRVRIVSGLRRTDLREKLFLFPDQPTVEIEAKFFAPPAAGLTRPEQLRGNTVAVMQGTIFQTLLEGFGGVKVLRKPSQEEALAALWNGEAQGYFGPDKNAFHLIWKNEYKNVSAIGRGLGQSPMYFGIYRGDEELLGIVNKGLARIRSSGEYDRIWRKWFVVEPGPEELDGLAARASEAAVLAYARPGGRSEGAALLTGSGRIWVGSRIEASAPGADLGAFETALAAAVGAGDLEIRAAAGMTADGRLVLPSARERQLLLEFGRGVLVLVEPQPGRRETWTITRLLPLAEGRAQAGGGE